MLSKDAKNILVVDDSIFFRVKLDDMLTEAGHRVAVTSDGREAIEAIKAEVDIIDLLVLDLDMPDIDGFGVIDWIDANGLKGKFPVIIMTSIYEYSKVLERLRGTAVTGFISKDLTPQEMVFQFNRHLFCWKVAEGARSMERVPVSTPVQFILGERVLKACLLNIGETGLFLTTGVVLSTGDIVELHFTLPGIDKEFDLEGRVIWSTSEVTDRTTFPGGGIKFTNLMSEDKELLKTFIADELKRLGLYSFEVAAPAFKTTA
jgi:uncharacterized protein (TIGR02266 family)